MGFSSQFFFFFLSVLFLFSFPFKVFFFLFQICAIKNAFDKQTNGWKTNIKLFFLFSLSSFGTEVFYVFHKFIFHIGSSLEKHSKVIKIKSKGILDFHKKYPKE